MLHVSIFFGFRGAWCVGHAMSENTQHIGTKEVMHRDAIAGPAALEPCFRRGGLPF
jgi:hypothetical protein